MKSHLLSALLFVVCCLLSLVLLSCSSDDSISPEEPIAVTYNSLAGTWQLTEYYDQPLAQGQYLYLTFTRKERTIQLRSNIDSQNERVQTGTYTISGDAYYGYQLSGTYGIVAGDWLHSYKVQLYASGYMLWTATDNPNYRQVFRRQEAE